MIGLIRSAGSSDAQMGGHKLQPDAQFEFRNTEKPGLIIEVAHTERFAGREGLEARAHRFILKGKGLTNAAIGLEIGDRPRLSIWTPFWYEMEDGSTSSHLTQRQTKARYEIPMGCRETSV